jgi:hypothetical protein
VRRVDLESLTKTKVPAAHPRLGHKHGTYPFFE